MGTHVVERVLVVDDDELILSALRRAFTYAHRSVFTTKDPAAAPALAQTEHVDLAVIDLRLGTVSGIDVIREMKRRMPHVQVVLMCACMSVASAVEAVRADVVVYKPVSAPRSFAAPSGDAPRANADLGKRPSLEMIQHEHIMRVAARCRGNISEAARQLGIPRQSLQRRLRRHAPKA